MKPTTIRQELAYLRATIQKHNYNYYILNQPTISDYEFDQLFQRLQQLEQEYPALISPNSPTQTVGAPVKQQLSKINHMIPMLSLDNAFSDAEVLNFAQKLTERCSDATKISYVCEPKLDGVAVNLRYEFGYLTQAATRGDGNIGEDITANIMTISDIPHKLLGDTMPEIIEIRGEVYMTYAALEQFNQLAHSTGHKILANTRNAASGSLRQINSKITAQRNLSFFSYGIGFVQHNSKAHDNYLHTQRAILEQLKVWGMPVNPLYAYVDDLNAGIDFFNYMADKRMALPYAIDGIVYKVNEIKLQNQLGATNRSPRWAIAHKFAALDAYSCVNKVEFQVGRTGMITPVAHLQPTNVGGVIVSRATLHNMADIMRKDIRLGDTVIIRRAGDVIPEIVEVVIARRTKATGSITLPQSCPICQAEIKLDPATSLARCTAGLSCPAQLQAAIKHFASRNAMNISGLGPQLIKQLLTEKLISNVADLYNLTVERLSYLPRMGLQSAENLIKSLQLSKQTTLARFLYALGVPNVGEVTAQKLAARYGTCDKLAAATVQELEQMHDIGPISAAHITNFFASHENQEIIQQLLNSGITWPNEQYFAENNALSGKSFMLTGTLANMTRAEAKQHLIAQGATILNSVSPKLDYLIVGANPGAKLVQAQKLNVTILNEDDFSQLIATKSS